MIIKKETVHQLQTLAAQVLHNPQELYTMSVGELTEIINELNDIRLEILADICVSETADYVPGDLLDIEA